MVLGRHIRVVHSTLRMGNIYLTSQCSRWPILPVGRSLLSLVFPNSTDYKIISFHLLLVRIRLVDIEDWRLVLLLLTVVG